VKRAVTLTLCVVTAMVGLWVITASHTLGSACTLSARSVGNACISGWPFYALGIALTLAGVVSALIAVTKDIRESRQASKRQDPSTISTLHQQGEEPLREVA
jgi:hypothetical protein